VSTLHRISHLPSDFRSGMIPVCCPLASLIAIPCRWIGAGVISLPHSDCEPVQHANRCSAPRGVVDPRGPQGPRSRRFKNQAGGKASGGRDGSQTIAGPAAQFMDEAHGENGTGGAGRMAAGKSTTADVDDRRIQA